MPYRNRLRDLREDHDWTQKQLAEKLYMQVTQYRRYETGERAIPLELACTLADLFGVSLDYFAGRTLYDGAISAATITDPEKDLLTKYRRLSRTNRIRLDERLDALLDMQQKQNTAAP